MILSNGGKKLRDTQQRYQDSKNSISNGESVRTKWKNGGSWEYRQGRSERQYEDSMRIMTGACLGLGLVVIGLIVYGIIS